MATNTQKTGATTPKPKKEIPRGKRIKPTKQLAPNKLVLLVTVVPRKKAEYFLDLIQSFEANLQLECSAFGTAIKHVEYVDGDAEKQALFSIIRQDKAHEALATLQSKFGAIRGAKGIAFTVPLSSMVGVAAYQFLSNKA